MVYVQFLKENEKHIALLKSLGMNLDGFKFGLIPFSELKNQVDSKNKSTSEKIYLHEIIQPDMICMEAHKQVLELEEANNAPEVVRARAERESRINEREFQAQVNKQKAKSSGLFGNDLKDMEKSISFGVSFIFSFFLSGVSGYYFGKIILGLNEGLSMVLAVIALIGTLIIESVLFILKTWKSDKIAKQREEESKLQKARLQQSQSIQITKLAQEYQVNKEKSAKDKKQD